MKNGIYIVLTIVLIFFTTLSAYSFNLKFWEKKAQKVEHIEKSNVNDFEILATIDSKSNAKNQVWVGTFQLVWNDLIEGIIHHPVEFVNYKSDMADKLNQQAFSVNELSENSYYKKWGLVSPSLKNEIENGIKEKFNEKSDILDQFDWTPAEKKYILYAMLKKDFEYIQKFDKLEDGYFIGSEGDVKYFGVNKDTSYKVRNSINVLFYLNPNEYAVSLKSKQGDVVYLYRTDDTKTLYEYYSDMKRKALEYNDRNYLASKDEFKAPIIDFKSERQFDELSNKPIKNSDFIISKAIETIQFKMDEVGVKLKSEAAIALLTSCMPGNIEQPRYYYFDNKYVIFLEEEGKKPYFGMKIEDVKKLQK